MVLEFNETAFTLGEGKQKREETKQNKEKF